jgi:hypothetical protein
MYQVFFVDVVGDVFAVEVLLAESDEIAKARASRIMPTRIGAGFEIWRNGVLIQRVRFRP